MREFKMLVQLCLGCLLSLCFLHTCKGVGTYTVTSRVIPHDVRRQGLVQENPCPGDMVEFICTRSESSPAAVRWNADGEALYTFFIPSDISTSNSNRSSVPGLIGVLGNETKLTLLVDLNTTTKITNNTGITCGELGITSQTMNLMTIGLVSPPTISIQPVDLIGLLVNVTIPDYGSVCVDRYRASINGLQSPSSNLSQTVAVTNSSQQAYTFDFTLDVCRDALLHAVVTANAISNGVEGAIEAVNIIDKFSRFTLTSQIFNSTGVKHILTWEVLNSTFLNNLNISCSSVEDTEQVNCKRIASDTSFDKQLVIFIPYNGNLTKKSDLRVTYSSQVCVVLQVDIKVKTLNSTPPQVSQDMQQLTISFTVNETLLDVDLVRVIFSSNCTDSETSVAYTNPVLITIPNTRLNTGQCNYSIQLVDGNSQQIGYAITGLFQSVSASSRGNVIGIVVGVTFTVIVVLAIIATIIIIVVILLVKKNQGKMRIHLNEINTNSSDSDYGNAEAHAGDKTNTENLKTTSKEEIDEKIVETKPGRLIYATPFASSKTGGKHLPQPDPSDKTNYAEIKHEDEEHTHYQN